MEFLAILIAVALLGLLVLWIGMRLRRRRISPAAAERLRKQWTTARGLQDPVRRVLECDNVLSAALREVGVPGGLGAQLKKAGARFSNLDAIWRAHKLRNRIAHEPGMHVDERAAAEAVSAFGRALESLLG